jgi:hypothetical protein
MSTTEATNVNANLRKLAEAGTSPWLDLLRRSLVQQGELARMVAEDSLKGVTSNPSIFEKAILDSDDYNEELAELAGQDLDAQDIYERIAIADVQHACDVLRETWESHHHQDGFVSLEIAADMAHDGERSIAAARDFWKRVNRPNVMIKIPGTPEGLSAVEQAIYEGIHRRPGAPPGGGQVARCCVGRQLLCLPRRHRGRQAPGGVRQQRAARQGGDRQRPPRL